MVLPRFHVTARSRSDAEIIFRWLLTFGTLTKNYCLCYLQHAFAGELRYCSALYFMVIARYMGSGIKGLWEGGIRDHSLRIRDQGLGIEISAVFHRIRDRTAESCVIMIKIKKNWILDYFFFASRTAYYKFLALSSVLACHAVVDNFRFSAFDFIIVSVVWSVPLITSFVTWHTRWSRWSIYRYWPFVSPFSTVENIVATCSLYFCVFRWQTMGKKKKRTIAHVEGKLTALVLAEICSIFR